MDPCPVLPLGALDKTEDRINIKNLDIRQDSLDVFSVENFLRLFFFCEIPQLRIRIGVVIFSALQTQQQIRVLSLCSIIEQSVLHLKSERYVLA